MVDISDSYISFFISSLRVQCVTKYLIFLYLFLQCSLAQGANWVGELGALMPTRLPLQEPVSSTSSYLRRLSAGFERGAATDFLRKRAWGVDRGAGQEGGRAAEESSDKNFDRGTAIISAVMISSLLIVAI